MSGVGRESVSGRGLAQVALVSRIERLVRRLFRPPAFADEQDRRAAALANAVLWVSAAGPLVYLLTLRYMRRPSLLDVTPLLVAIAVPLVGVWALHRGWLRATTRLLVATFIVVPVWGSLDSGGVRAPALTTIFLAVALAGQLLGVRAALLTAAAGALAVVGLVALASVGALPPLAIVHSDRTHAASLLVQLIALGAFAAFAARLVQKMLVHLRNEQEALRVANRYIGESLEASPDAIVSTDLDGVITQSNRAHERSSAARARRSWGGPSSRWAG